MAGNAARCALELAVLDAYGRRFGEPLGRAVELADVPGLPRSPAPPRPLQRRRSPPSRAAKERISAW